MVLSRRIWPPRAGRPPCPSANALRKRTVHRFLVEGRCTLDRGAPDHRPAHVRYRKPLPHRALEGRGLWPQRALHRCDRSCRHVAQRRAQHGGHKVQGGLRSHRMGHAQGQHLLHVDSHDLRGSPTAPDTCLPSLDVTRAVHAAAGPSSPRRRGGRKGWRGGAVCPSLCACWARVSKSTVLYNMFMYRDTKLPEPGRAN